MRNFSIDAPKFFCFSIGDSEKVYKVPLAASMPIPVLKLLDDGVMGQYELLKKYLGDDLDEIPAEVFNQIMKAWEDASKEQGATPGESEALSD